MTISIIVADANILYSRTLRDYFLYAADEGVIEIHWSQQILDEMSRALRAKVGLSKDATDRLEALMNNFIEYPLVVVEPEDQARVDKVEMDAKDRHVLAATLSAHADILLTENTRHFPREWMAEHGIELIDSAGLLLRLAHQFPDQMRAAHAKTVRMSPKTEAEILTTLEAVVGRKATDALRNALRAPHSKVTDALLSALRAPHWQQRLWMYYHFIEELRRAVDWVSGWTSTIGLVVERQSDRQDWQKADPLKESDLRAIELLHDLFESETDEYQFLNDAAQNMLLWGETYLVQRKTTPDVKSGSQWQLWKAFTAYDHSEQLITVDVETGEQTKFVASPMSIRLWNRHPRDAILADCSIRASLQSLEIMASADLIGAEVQQLRDHYVNRLAASLGLPVPLLRGEPVQEIPKEAIHGLMVSPILDPLCRGLTERYLKPRLTKLGIKGRYRIQYVLNLR
ncbi:MAG: PIN domain-containing protein [Propionibacteriaceae bacterium]|nr:PIN domain-containing protein [Propionibacteriaceae bacterium]